MWHPFDLRVKPGLLRVSPHSHVQLKLRFRWAGGNISGMEIADSARKHGVLDEDIEHAVQWALRRIFQSDNPVRVLFIGADRNGTLLEVIVLDPSTPDAVAIHAMPLRKKFHRFL